METPIAMRIPVDEATVQAVEARGPGACLTHPRARSRGGRVELRRALTEAGLGHRLAMTLSWATSGGHYLGVVHRDVKAEKPTEPKSRKRKRREAEAAEVLATPLADAVE